MWRSRIGLPCLATMANDELPRMLLHVKNIDDLISDLLTDAK
jgi:hypothetical protein